jgi:hypothetical protein
MKPIAGPLRFFSRGDRRALPFSVPFDARPALRRTQTVLTYPASMSAESYQDLADHLEIFLRKDKRRSSAGPSVEREVKLSLPSQEPEVTFMITQEHKARLRQLSHSKTTINNMTPAEAHKLLGIIPPPPY